MFNMFLDCASEILAAPPISVIKLWLENHVFTFLSSSLKQPVDGTTYYARRLPKLGHHCLLNYSETPPTGILAEF